MLQESLKLIGASVCQLQQLAAILSNFLQQMLHVAHDRKTSIRVSTIQWWHVINEKNVVNMHMLNETVSFSGSPAKQILVKMNSKYALNCMKTSKTSTRLHLLARSLAELIA